MSYNKPFLSLAMTCEQAIAWITHVINSSDLQVQRTFDLQLARAGHASCPCPHHGTDQCDCQMVILLIYGGILQPVSIVAHGYNGQTWISVVDTPQQRADPGLEAAICRALMPQCLSPNTHQNLPRAI